MTSEYVYAPLDLSKDSLRLLRLCKGRPGAQIRCQVFQSLLSESEGIPYEALSYTWGGQPTDSSPCILLDGQRFPVTKNLFDALHALRLRSLDRLLWVDALCINQRDPREKGHQVGQMGSVYRNADTVLVWLGPSSAAIDDLMTILNLEASWSATVAQLEAGHKVVYKRHETTFARLVSQRAWFKRVWIIQEVANARVAVIICGSKSVSSRIFSTMPHLMQLEIDHNMRAVLDVMPGPLRKQSWWNADRRLITLLTKFYGSEATQEHDRIYALLGIASDTDALGLPIDYSCHFQQVVDQMVSRLALGNPNPSCFLYNLGTPTFEFSEVFGKLANTNEIVLRVFELAFKRQETAFLKHMMDTPALKTVSESTVSNYKWDLSPSGLPSESFFYRESVFEIYSRADRLGIGHTPLMAAFDSVLLKQYDLASNNFWAEPPQRLRLERFFQSIPELQFRNISQRVQALISNEFAPIFDEVAYSGTGQQMDILLEHRETHSNSINIWQYFLDRFIPIAFDRKDDGVFKALLKRRRADGIKALSAKLLLHLTDEADDNYGRCAVLLNTLIDGGVDIDAPFDHHLSKEVNAFGHSDKITPLRCAIYANSPALVKVLVQEGAKLGGSTEYGETPLHYAERICLVRGRDRRRVIAVLLQCGADELVENRHGRTPWQVNVRNRTGRKRRNREEVEDLLSTLVEQGDVADYSELLKGREND
ncbi:hypothetical protein PG990_003072 [Apiospora arundinis]